jgi:hypothetical protein
MRQINKAISKLCRIGPNNQIVLCVDAEPTIILGRMLDPHAITHIVKPGILRVAIPALAYNLASAHKHSANVQLLTLATTSSLVGLCQVFVDSKAPMNSIRKFTIASMVRIQSHENPMRQQRPIDLHVSITVCFIAETVFIKRVLNPDV